MLCARRRTARGADGLALAVFRFDLKIATAQGLDQLSKMLFLALTVLDFTSGSQTLCLVPVGAVDTRSRRR